jgi:hypothetical protein
MSTADRAISPFRSYIFRDRCDRVTSIPETPHPGGTRVSMNELRILRRCFAYATFIFALLSFVVVPTLLHAPFPQNAYFHPDPASIILLLMRQLILALPPVLAVVNGVAWWMLKTNRPSSRRWAMAASSLFLLYSLPFFIADIVILEYSMSGTVAIIGVFVSSLFFSALGVTGLAYFSRFESMAPAAAPVVVRQY